MGKQTKRQFSTKNDATGQKNDFFIDFFFFCRTSSRRDENLLSLPNLHIFSRSVIPWGDKEKRYINDEQRRTNDNDERTTTTNDELH